MMLIRKTRRISYAKRAKSQRMKLYTLLTVLLLLFSCSLAPLADDGKNEVTVTVDSGDTLWDLCAEYKPEDMDLRLFIDKVMYENDLNSSALSIGQELMIPLR